MESLLNEFISTFLFTYLMVFVRFGTALVIMPGIGDAFVSQQIRLYFGLALSLVVAPALVPHIPTAPSSAFVLAGMIVNEAIIGFFIGLIARIMMSALGTAGMVISMQSGLASAQVFNPTMSGQGSIIGAFYSIAGVVLIFATNLHHLLILSVFHSYDLFPFAPLLQGAVSVGDLSNTIARIVNDSFVIGVQFAAPFIIVGLMINIALGIMARLMPQLQIFFLALPLQILVSLLMLVITTGTALMYWLGFFENNLIGLLGVR